LVNSEFCYSALSKVINVNNISLIYCPFKIISKKTLEKENLYLQEKPYIVFIGNVSKNKGIFELLDAMRIFAQNEPNAIKLLFCGELNDPLSALQNNCNYLGPLDYMNTMKLLFGADLLILPSKSESHPRVIIESIIYKVPFLMTRGVSELEQHFPENMLENIEPKHIASRINDCLYDNSPNRSNTYPIHLHQIDNVINQLYKVYENLY
jgi:glycosyltransferase involved in cell wall biosynthesis